jgi:hypothetical protein
MGGGGRYNAILEFKGANKKIMRKKRRRKNEKEIKKNIYV